MLRIIDDRTIQALRRVGRLHALALLGAGAMLGVIGSAAAPYHAPAGPALKPTPNVQRAPLPLVNDVEHDAPALRMDTRLGMPPASRRDD